MSADQGEPGSLEPGTGLENVIIAEFDDFAKYIADVVNVLLPADDGVTSNFSSVVNEPASKVTIYENGTMAIIIMPTLHRRSTS